MLLTRHTTPVGPRWAADGRYLPAETMLDALLGLARESMLAALSAAPRGEPADGPLLAPLEDRHEVWACGVTYLRSRDARTAESAAADVYTRVYDAERPEIFFKATGWRAVGHGGAIGIRQDSAWNVPEPELTLVVNAALEIVGYTAGNDVSSRSIEGENPLYLPQAKTYRASCALGPGLVLAEADTLRDLPIGLRIARGGAEVYQGTASTAQLKRRLEDLVRYAGAALNFPGGALLMTGTCLVPPDEFTLQPDDEVTVTVGKLTLVNTVMQV